MARLTKRYVDSLKPADKDYVVWDDALPGFGVRVMPSGYKSFCVQYRNTQGRSRRMTLGRYGQLTLAEARKQARQALAQADTGQDPAEARDQARQAVTIKDLAGDYLERHAKPKKKPQSYARDKRLIERFIVPQLGNKTIEGLTRAHVVRMHHKVGKTTPIQANRTLAVLSKMMTLAIRWGLRTDETNPCRYVERFAETKRRRYLDADELSRLGAALAKFERGGVGSPAAINAIRFLVLSGMRLGEALGLRWDDVDLEHSLLHLPDSKTGAKTVALGAPALELLRSLPRHAGNPHCFPGRRFGSPLVNLYDTWRKVCDEAELTDCRIHDLRHTFGSAGAAAGVSLTVVGGLLGHSEPATTARYSHLSQSPQKQAADLIAGQLDEAMKAPARGKVVDLNARRKRE